MPEPPTVHNGSNREKTGMPEPVRQLHRTIGRGTALDWSLVLEAKSIPHAIEKDGPGYRIAVDPGFGKAAERQIRLFREERLADRNRNVTHIQPERETAIVPLIAGLCIPALFFMIGQAGPRGPELLARGGGSARAILAGEWWRAATALTLHADFGHLASNLVFGGVVIGALQRLVGSGPAWFIAVAAGTLGNLLTASIQTGLYRSIGASTAVFGALGALTILGIPAFHRRKRQNPWLSAGAGTCLLLLLGTSPGSDLTGHAMGFIAGIMIGIPLSSVKRRYTNPSRIIGLLPAGFLAFCWTIALMP